MTGVSNQHVSRMVNSRDDNDNNNALYYTAPVHMVLDTRTRETRLVSIWL